MNNYKSTHDPLGDGIIARETAANKKVVLKQQTEKEKTADLQKSIDDNNETNGEWITY